MNDTRRLLPPTPSLSVGPSVTEGRNNLPPFLPPSPLSLIAVKRETTEHIEPKPVSPYESLVYQNMIVFTNNILYYAKKGAAGKMTLQDSLHMKNDMQSLQVAMRLHDETALFWPNNAPQPKPVPPPSSQAMHQPAKPTSIPIHSQTQVQVQMQLQTTTHTQLQTETKRNVSTSTQSSSSEKQQECLCCKTVDTPIWRKGPNGPATLCNACGLKFMRANKKRKKSVSVKKPLKKGVEPANHRSNIYSILN